MVVGAVVALIAVALPWASAGEEDFGPFDDDVAFRLQDLRSDEPGRLDAIVLLVVGIGALAAAGLAAVPGLSPAGRAAGGAAGPALVGLGLMEILYVNDVGQGVDPGFGLYLLIVGGVIATAGALLPPTRAAPGASLLARYGWTAGGLAAGLVALIVLASLGATAGEAGGGAPVAGEEVAGTEQASPTATVPPSPTPTQEKPASGEYGSDPALDALWDRCAEGDLGACDKLYENSPIDSAYEEFGDTCGGQIPDGIGRPRGVLQTCVEVLGGGGEAAEGEYGSDPALDALWDDCEAGDFAACDQLYFESPVGSEYEEFGDTCGGRQPAGTGVLCVDAFGGGGAAEGEYGSDPALDALWDNCEAGDMAGCDQLYFDSPVGSAYEEFGDTCGGRQPVGTGVLCVDAFGP